MDEEPQPDQESSREQERLEDEKWSHNDYDEVIDRLLHYRDGPGYVYLWELIQSDLDADTPPEVVERKIWKLVIGLRHDGRFSIEESQRILASYLCLITGRLPFDRCDEEQRRLQADDREAEQEWHRLRRHQLLASAAEDAERRIRLIPDALGRLWRGARAAMRGAVGIGLTAAVIVKLDRDRLDR